MAPGRLPSRLDHQRWLIEWGTVDPVWLSVEENRYDALERYGDAVAALASKPVRTGANALWCSWYPIRMGINEDIVLDPEGFVKPGHF